MSEASIDISGQIFIPDRSGALYFPDQQSLVVADLHFEKGSSFAKSLNHIPPYDTRTTLRNLIDVCKRYDPRRIIALGDSFHDTYAHRRLNSVDSEAIQSLTDAHDWIWITGNHDPRPPVGFSGHVEEEISLGALTLRHEPQPYPQSEIAGHLHPCAVLFVRGRRFRRRCFASNGDRIVMPSFGAYTGGLNVLDVAFSSVFADRFQVWLIGGEDVHRVTSDKLRPDPQSSAKRYLYEGAK